MNLGIKKAIDNGNGDAIIYTALIAAMLANAVPTIADGYFFYKQQKWNEQKDKGLITPQQYWSRAVISYYTITAGYYGIVLLTMMALGKTSYSTKSKILLATLGGGAVIGVAIKNIQKDKEIAQLKKTTQNDSAKI